MDGQRRRRMLHSESEANTVGGGGEYRGTNTIGIERT